MAFRFKNKSLILNFGGYTIINLFNSLTPFIILPILTHNLDPEDIGIIDLFNTTYIFLTPVIGLCFIQSITKLYFSIKDTSGYLSVLATSVLALGGGTFLISLTVLYGTDLVDVSSDYRFMILLVFFYVFLNLIIEGFLLLKRNEENLRQFAWIRLSKSVLDIALTLLFVHLYMDFNSRIYAMVLSGLVIALVIVFRMIRNPEIKLHYNPDIGRKIFYYSYPLVFHTFFASILNYADRYFINNYLGTSELGHYAVAYQLCMIMSLLITSFNMAWLPFFMKRMTEGSAQFHKLTKRIFKYYGVVLFLFGLVLFSAIPVIYEYYVGSEYLVDRTIYLTLLAAYFFNGLYRFKVSHLFYRAKTLSVARLSLVTAVVNLVLNYICIRAWGIYGAAFSTLISYLLLYILLEIELFATRGNERTR